MCTEYVIVKHMAKTKAKTLEKDTSQQMIHQWSILSLRKTKSLRSAKMTMWRVLEQKKVDIGQRSIRPILAYQQSMA